MKQTCGVILAGVHRWGESGLDSLCPRALLPVGHAPLIGHTLDWFRRAGIADVVICANSATRTARRLIGDAAEYGVRVFYYEDRTPRGPAGCVRDAAMCTTAERLVVMDGTVFPDGDLSDVLRAHAAAGCGATVVVNGDPGSAPGTPASLRPAGVYVIDRTAVEQVPEIGYRDIKEELIPKLYAANVPVKTFTALRPIQRVVDAVSYLTVNAAALVRLCAEASPPRGYRRIDGGLVHESARLESQERTFGPVLVGPGSHVAAGAHLVGPCVIGADCLVERDAIVSQSVVWQRCRIGGGAVVDQCVLSDGTTIEPGAVRSGVAVPPAARRGTRGARQSARRVEPTAPAAAADSVGSEFVDEVEKPRRKRRRAVSRQVS